MNKKSYIYLDYAAATPTRKEVVKVMSPFNAEVFGNASSLHKQGRLAKKALEEARTNIAKVISAFSKEVVFTSGGTESCNLAIFGIAREHDETHLNKPGHIITSRIEHPAVLEPIKLLEKNGWQVTYLPVSREGLVRLADLKQAIQKNTVLISLMYANNEVGSIQPIQEIGKELFKLNAERKLQGLNKIIFHTDACQASGYLDISVKSLGVDLMTLNGSKIYGPKQTGILYIKAGTFIQPELLGGGQENNLRSGTENIAGAVGLAKSLELAQKEKQATTRKLVNLGKLCLKSVLKNIPGAKLNGPSFESGLRLPNNLNLFFQRVKGEDLVIYLDAKGIGVSTGSACASQKSSTSYVLDSLGGPAEVSGSSIRVSMGKDTTKHEIEYLVKSLIDCIKLL